MRLVRRLVPPLCVLALLLAAPAARAELTAGVNTSTKTVLITGDDAAEALIVGDNGSQLTHSIQSAALESPTDFDPSPGVQDVDADSTWQLVIDAGGGNDTITVETRRVLRVLADLGAGDDLFQGSTQAPGSPDEIDGGSGDDRLVAGRGADDVRGGEGHDVLVWNNGDGSDEFDGQGGTDVVEVNAAQAAGDDFHIQPADGRLRLDRLNLGLFSLLLTTTTERLRVDALGGDDKITAGAGVAALGVHLDLDGGTGNDAITGGDGADLIAGGFDADTLHGGAGDDTIMWRHGDGNDVADGGDGFDTMAVEGSGAGDAFTIKGNGARTSVAVAPFALDVSAELLDLDALAGDDSAIASGAPPILRDLDGGAGNDSLTGDAGHDALRGGSGADTLTGGAGSDVIDGDEGDDTVAARDDAADLVRCGGGSDKATLDGAALDGAQDCETADRPAAPPVTPPVTPPATAAGKPVTILTGKVKVKKGRAAIKLQCPAGAPACAGRLTLSTPRAVRIGRARVVVVLGGASYRIAPGATATVRVKLPKSLRAIAGRKRSLRARAVAVTEAAGGVTLTSSRTLTLTRGKRW